MLVAMLIAVRQALDDQSTWRAVGVCVIGWPAQALIPWIAISLLGDGPTSGVAGVGQGTSDSHSARIPASCSAKRSSSSAPGCVENLTTTVREGRWTSNACPFMPEAQ